ncbi:MAG: hypothetical protein SFU56_11475 [Capsulimonadales bacterium]|nr:hypothetical protein [Capsulimonadales bacterium]
MSDFRCRYLPFVVLPWVLLIALLGGPSSASAAHPPKKGVKRPPSKAAAQIRAAGQRIDAAKKRLRAEGKYGCCLKPAAGRTVGGCEHCLKTAGECRCAANLRAGKGVCGQCVAGWKAGQGAIAGIDRDRVRWSPSEPSESKNAATEVPELIEARELLTMAKRTMVAEGRYVCCIGDGGCDECALEGDCPCGIELNEGAEGQGVCGSCYDGWHAGHGSFEGVEIASVRLNVQPGHGSGDDRDVFGMFGDWRMNREGSGTAWLPDSSPLYAQMTRWGDFRTMLHGYGYGVYTDQKARGNRRGDDGTFVASQIMGMAWQRKGNAIFGGRMMLSADPWTIGDSGYPLLFQTGETANGRPLVDRQHPHDLFMELAAAYTQRLTPNGGALSLYLAPVGEPAIGPPAFAHRPSAFDNPEAPISHHWFDSTHITYGVATVGLANRAVKLEGSLFTGREPDENRERWDRFRWDSTSVRLAANPTRDLAFQISQAWLRRPEALEPDTDQRRYTASVLYNRPLAEGRANLQSSLMWARNRKYAPDHAPANSDALLFETAFLAPEGTLFGRWERTDKDELFPGMEDHRAFRVNKFTLGGVHNLAATRGAELGIGGSVSAFSIPAGLKPDYGSSPLTFNLFLRLRSARMMH